MLYKGFGLTILQLLLDMFLDFSVNVNFFRRPISESDGLGLRIY